MKRNPIALAVGTALAAGFSASAFAHPANQYNAGTDLDIYISGASAQENQVKAYARLVCAAGTIDLYKASNQFAFYCTTKNAAGLTAVGINLPASLQNRRIVMRKSSVGGSNMGNAPVRDSTPVQFLNFSNIAAAEAGTTLVCATSVAGVVGNQASLIEHNCSTANDPTSAPASWFQNTVPVGGFSDVEPGIFGESTAGLNVTSTNQLLFGVPVTLNVYRELQIAQGLPSADSSDWNCTKDVAWAGSGPASTDIRAPRNDCEVNIPTLSKGLLNGMYTQNVFDWNTVDSAIPSDSVYIARRVNSSGTQKSAELYFTNQPCDVTTTAIPGADTTACDGSGLVFEGSGSSNVVTCMSQHQDGGRRAIGVLSTEFVPALGCAHSATSCAPASITASGSNNGKIRFIKIDGFAPTLVNAAQGKYDYFYEAVCNTRTAGSSDSKTFVSEMCGELGKTAVIREVNPAFRSVQGDGGLLGSPDTVGTTPVTPLSHAALRATPISAVTRSPGGVANSCHEPTALFSTK